MGRYAPLLILAALTACAQVREPQGGPKDEKTPLLEEAQPPNGSVRFADDRIVLRFNERVKLDRVRERLLISPPLERAPEVSVSGQEVTIHLREQLKPNTTYTFNIGEAVVDITENNPAAGMTYVCSTGDVLDSLMAVGVVGDAFTDEPVGGVLVMLRADTDTAGFTRGRPAYFTRTDKSGRFVLEHLRPGRYRLHALRDQNANYRYDLPNEDIAFAEELIDVSDTVPHMLRLFRETAAVQQVTEAIVQPDRCWRIILARPATALEVRSLDRTGDPLRWSTEWNSTRDTLLLWPSDTTLLQGQRFELADTSGVIDTLTYRAQRKMPFNLDVRLLITPGEPVTLFATRPITQIDQSRVRIWQDSTLFITTDQLTTILEQDTAAARRAHLALPLVEDQSFELELLPGALQDIYGGSNDSLSFPIGARKPQDTGSLRIDLAADSGVSLTGPFVLNVLTTQGSLVHTERFAQLPHRVERPDITAAMYELKLIADTNADGRWSPGSLKKGRQPERVFRHADALNVRAGWEVAVEWAIH